MSEVIIPALAITISAIIAGLTSWFTARASARGTVQASQVASIAEVEAAKITSLAEIEQAAGQRAFKYYEDLFGRQEQEAINSRQEIAELRIRVTNTETALNAANRELRECRNTCRALARRLPGGDDGPVIEVREE